MGTSGSDLYKATTGSFWETMTAHNDNVGYRIPIYQRDYHWDQGHLRRLLSDCLRGFSRHCDTGNDHEAFTYFGSIILTATETEETYSALSFDIVDGQQRLTSLTLAACALYNALEQQSRNLGDLCDHTKRWLMSEVEALKNLLYACAVGHLLKDRKDTFPYPRIIRSDSDDVRAPSPRHAKYGSPIAKFIAGFSNNCTQANIPTSSVTSEDKARDHIEEMYRFIETSLNRYVLGINDSSDGVAADDDIEVVESTSFTGRGCRSLFLRLSDYATSMQESCCDVLSSPGNSQGLIRLILFASYLTEYVLLTRVETQREEDAFDIFDALNTTGEPLTALETCKPLVAMFEEQQEGYAGSQTERYWSDVNEVIASTYSNAETRQRAVKQLVIAFALYLTGTKTGADLVIQRRYMRDQFVTAKEQGPSPARAFVKALHDLTSFRTEYWTRGNLATMGEQGWNSHENDALKLCLNFLMDMQTTLVVPILARYWAEGQHMRSSRQFLEATKAVTAFVVLRRSATRGTERIDSCLRDIMAGSSRAKRLPLCLGVKKKHPVLPVTELRSAFQAMLASKRVGVKDGTTWVNAAKRANLGNTAPSALKRFLILSAVHQARPDKGIPGHLSRDDAIESLETDYLNHWTWESAKYKTVEHVAPDSQPGHGWDPGIYKDADTRHLLGNLVLLPEKENATIGNAGWTKKRLFYKTLASSSPGDRQRFVEEAQREGIDFGKKATRLMQDQEHLSLLNHMAEVEEWTKEVIEERTQNLLDLAWEQISPWLFGE